MRIRMRRGAAAVVAVSALCFTAAACSGSSDEEKKPAASADEQAEDKADDKAKDGESGEDKAAEQPAAALTATQLKAATLEVKDLPDGWKADPTADDDSPAPKADKPECQPIAGLMAAKIEGATSGESADFATQGDESHLSQSVFTFDGAGASDFTKAIGTAVDSCAQAGFEQDGETLNVKIAKLSAPQVAEESHAFSMTVAIPGLGDLETNVLIARQGAGVTRLAYIPGQDPAAKEAFGDLAKRTGDKLVQAAQG